MSGPGLKRILWASTLALCLAVLLITLLEGFATTYPLRFVQGIMAAVAVAGLVGIVIAFASTRMGHYTSPEDEEEFERLVVRSERLAKENLAAEPDEVDFMALDPRNPADFEELVREALDDLPDLRIPLIENHNVAGVISDGGRRRGAYGLYHGDGATRDDVPDRIVIYRDTLRRDFGHDADLLRAQVTQTVRHELAHHVGFDELGVSRLDL